MWNGKYPGCRETFTGWTDVELSPIGINEAMRTGKLLAEQTSGLNIDAMFTSTLMRAKITAHHCWWAYYDKLEQVYNDRRGKAEGDDAASQYQPPSEFVMDYRLNERHYGSLQGFVKHDVEIGLHGHAPEDVYEWRRSWHAVPPEMPKDDPRHLEELRKFGNICGMENVPRSESLASVAKDRIRPFLDGKLTPFLDSVFESKESAEGGTALVVAHANSLRALIGVLCNVEDDPEGVALRKLERMKIPTASPMVMKYRKSSDGKYFPVDFAMENELENSLPVYPLSTLSMYSRPEVKMSQKATEASEKATPENIAVAK
jgi:2,3-bisphosphoglycerate-dependent phosphoglycerate mutase